MPKKPSVQLGPRVSRFTRSLCAAVWWALILAGLPLANDVSAQTSAYSDGLADRTAFENWIASLGPGEKTGADYWAAQRSLRNPGPCIRSDGNSAWVAGCREAQRRLGQSDARRLSEPEYRLGWNAFQETPQSVTVASPPQNPAKRGWLGVNIQSVTPEIAANMRLREPIGALVASVEGDSPAQAANVHSGDIILKFDGQDVGEMLALPRIVAATPIGREVPMVVWRNGDEIMLTARVGETPPAKSVRGTAVQSPPPPPVPFTTVQQQQQQQQQLDWEKSLKQTCYEYMVKRFTGVHGYGRLNSTVELIQESISGRWFNNHVTVFIAVRITNRDVNTNRIEASDVFDGFCVIDDNNNMLGFEKTLDR